MPDTRAIRRSQISPARSLKRSFTNDRFGSTPEVQGRVITLRSELITRSRLCGQFFPVHAQIIATRENVVDRIGFVITIVRGTQMAKRGSSCLS